jgi:hypothetical protein
MGNDGTVYRARLGRGAAVRGERVICAVLGWTGADDSLACVRVVHSTMPGVRTGHTGLVPRDRLSPVGRTRAPR